MRNSIRRELNKLREIARVALAGQRCYFCGKPLLAPADFAAGNGNGPPLTDKLTVHHKNEDHSDNRPSNHALCHQTCHKKYHAHRILHGRSVRVALKVTA